MDRSGASQFIGVQIISREEVDISIEDQSDQFSPALTTGLPEFRPIMSAVLTKLNGMERSSSALFSCHREGRHLGFSFP